VVLIDPDGTNEKRISLDQEKSGRGKITTGEVRLSPDGKTLAGFNLLTTPPPRRELYVRRLGEDFQRDTGIVCDAVFWSGDGTELACNDSEGRTGEPTWRVSHFIVNVRTKERTPVKLPADHLITDWSRDGKFFLTMRVTRDKVQLFLMNRDGTVYKALPQIDGRSMNAKLAPAGDRALYNGLGPANGQDERPRQLCVVDVATGKSAAVELLPGGFASGFCWSPDGKRIAYCWRQRHTGTTDELMQKETESRLVVCDPDGRNARTIATEKGRGRGVLTIGSVDWR
jgi:Tol biopolymer transport system component